STFSRSRSAEPHRAASALRRPLLPGHPLTNVGWAAYDSNSALFALHEEAHGFDVDEAHFEQVEDEAVNACLVARAPELGKLFAAEAPTDRQRASARFGVPSDLEHQG